jgi:hypothetical protein
MTDTYDKENHWYGWNGGECPVHPETEVECVADNGVCFGVVPARVVSWTHLEAGAVNVIAFRITRLYREPRKAREWWVNVYDSRVEWYATAYIAGGRAGDDRIECVHVREVLPEGDA